MGYIRADLEPYYPNRFACQFGFDKGVPSNNLSFSGHLRQRRNVMDLAQAFAVFCARDTGARFHILYSYYEGIYLELLYLVGQIYNPY